MTGLPPRAAGCTPCAARDELIGELVRAVEEQRPRAGKQPGSAGTAMTWAQPDELADHYPAGRCGCGADLAGAVDLGVARSFQHLEVPLIMR